MFTQFMIAIVATALITFITVCSTSVYAQDLQLLNAYQLVHRIPCPVPAEGNEKINQAKATITDPGSMVYFYLYNASDTPITVNDIVWQEKSFDQHRQAYQAIWFRTQPQHIPPGSEGELALCLRHSLTQPTTFTLHTDTHATLTAAVSDQVPPYRFQSITFSPDLQNVFLYIEQQDKQAGRPTTVAINHHPAQQCRWLNGQTPISNLWIAHITTDAIKEGAAVTFRLLTDDNTTAAAATIRAFSNFSVFGTYGGTSPFADYPRYAANGLNAYNSFRKKDKASLDLAHQLGIQVAMIVGTNPDPNTFGHPAIWAYGPTDEPDCKDFGAKDTPMAYRIGHNAPAMVDAVNTYRQDPHTPAKITVDLTFLPYNYYIYAPIADITNPDAYPITNNWSIRVIRDLMTNMKQAAAPKPFSYTYQGCWEEWAVPQDHWVDAEELREKGFDFYRDTTRTRGFPRPLTPDEVRIPMLYALGCGAKALFSYTDDTEVYGSLMFHSSQELPEIWTAIGDNSRALRMIAPLIEIAHPTDWITADDSHCWLSTLIAGDQGLLLIAVNENYRCEPDGFTITPAPNVTFTCPDLPWLKPTHVFRVEDGRFTPVPMTSHINRVKFSDTVPAAQLYWLTDQPDHAQRLQQQFDQQQTRQARAVIEYRRKNP